jgi:hypothetical protein
LIQQTLHFEVVGWIRKAGLIAMSSIYFSKKYLKSIGYVGIALPLRIDLPRVRRLRLGVFGNGLPTDHPMISGRL